MESTKKKLLSISNLKKYFPIAKSSLFQKERLYVKANEDISLDIYEGETIGMVGESGCGKSTFGRVLLQLYDQTAGETIYYGRTLAEVAPSYVKDTILHLPQYIKKYKKLQAMADFYAKQVETVGEDNADFFLLQNANLTAANAHTQLLHIVKVVGGFFAEGHNEGCPQLLAIFNTNVRIARLREKLADVNTKVQYYEGLDDIVKKDGTVVKAEDNPTLHKWRQKAQAIEDQLQKALADLQVEQTKLESIKAKYRGTGEFDRYDAMLDDGIDLARLKYKEIRPLRRDLQIIFQDPYSSLNPRMTVGQIIEEGLVTHKFYRHGAKAMREDIIKTMEECGLQDYMLHRYPHQFSGGQRQRICIARALAVHPKFVVCDECVSALDVSIQSQIINLLDELKAKENLTYLFISHDLSVVRYISDKIAVMYLGNLVEFADSEVIFNDPRHPYTVALLSSIPTTDIDSLSKERILLEGNIPSPIRPPQGCKFHTRCYMKCDKCDRVPPPLVEVEPGHFVACHRLERKVGGNGEYLFELPKMVKKTVKVDGVKVHTAASAEESTDVDETVVDTADVVEPEGGVVDAVMDPDPHEVPAEGDDVPDAD